MSQYLLQCCLYEIKSDTVAVLAVLPRYQRYYHGNRYKFYGTTAILGSKFAGSRGDGDQACGTTAVMGLGLHEQ